MIKWDQVAAGLSTARHRGRIMTRQEDTLIADSTKHGVVGLMRSLAVELGQHHIRV